MLALFLLQFSIILYSCSIIHYFLPFLSLHDSYSSWKFFFLNLYRLLYDIPYGILHHLLIYYIIYWHSWTYKNFLAKFWQLNIIPACFVSKIVSTKTAELLNGTPALYNWWTWWLRIVITMQLNATNSIMNTVLTNINNGLRCFFTDFFGTFNLLLLLSFSLLLESPYANHNRHPLHCLSK